MAATTKSVPCLDLTSDPKTLERGSEEWKATSQRVCEALETYGCMLVEYNRINQEEMLKAVHSFFDVPLETREKSHRASNKAFIQMDQTGAIPVFENIGVQNAVQPEKAKAFTDSVWPKGNQAFCETLNTTSKKMLELVKTVMNMICDSFEVKLEAESAVVSEEAVVRLIRYAAPGNDIEAYRGVPEHVDGDLLTILFQNEVDGLQIQSSNGERHEVKLRSGSLIVFVGLALKAWSNAQFHAVPHKVDVSGYKDRLSFGVFWKPNVDKIVQVHPKFVEKQRPPLYKPFVFGEFFKFYKENKARADSLDVYAPTDATSNGTFES